MTRLDFLKMGPAGCAMLFSPSLFADALARKKKSTTLLLGGGAFTLGYALAHPDETIILERGLHLGADFVGTGAYAVVSEPTTEIGKMLKAGLLEAGLVKDGRLELPPAADYISVFFARHGGTAFLNAEPYEIRKTGDGWSVTVYGGGSEGLRDFAFANIVDTTDCGWRNGGLSALSGRRMIAITTEGEFGVDLPAATDWHVARLALYREWKSMPRKGKILCECNRLKSLYRSDRNDFMIEPGIRWIPSAQHADLISAFERGASWSLH